MDRNRPSFSRLIFGACRLLLRRPLRNRVLYRIGRTAQNCAPTGHVFLAGAGFRTRPQIHGNSLRSRVYRIGAGFFGALFIFLLNLVGFKNLRGFGAIRNQMKILPSLFTILNFKAIGPQLIRGVLVREFVFLFVFAKKFDPHSVIAFGVHSKILE